MFPQVAVVEAGGARSPPPAVCRSVRSKGPWSRPAGTPPRAPPQVVVERVPRASDEKRGCGGLDRDRAGGLRRRREIALASSRRASLAPQSLLLVSTLHTERSRSGRLAVPWPLAYCRAMNKSPRRPRCAAVEWLRAGLGAGSGLHASVCCGARAFELRRSRRPQGALLRSHACRWAASAGVLPSASRLWLWLLRQALFDATPGAQEGAGQPGVSDQARRLLPLASPASRSCRPQPRRRAESIALALLPVRELLLAGSGPLLVAAC